MKISKIEIVDFHQFKDFTIDLTYPKGHAKEGKPLDKVCFIGQSGTGKTTLLELIPILLYHYSTQLLLKSDLASIVDQVFFKIEFGLVNEYSADISFGRNPNKDLRPSYSRKWFNRKHNNTTTDASDASVSNYYNQKWIKEIATKLIYFPANLNYDIEIEEKKTSSEKAIVDFSKEKVSMVWNLILDKIQSYQEQELQIRQEISKTVEQASNNLDIIKQSLKKLEDWKKTEFNPIQDIADNCLDKLLQPYKLRVKTELDIKSKEDIGFIKIEDYNGNEIPNGLWSTGTKQVILSALPLFLLKPKHTIVLFDEPERSLYPDMQRFIIDYYSSLTNDCQFFYATHSPIIASNFEPWEIVELKFNDKGDVERELYYQDENHIDNYIVDPRFLNYDQILSKVFDVKNTNTDKRAEAIVELSMLKNQLEVLKERKELKTEQGKEIFNKYQDLSKKIFWNAESN